MLIKSSYLAIFLLMTTGCTLTPNKPALICKKIYARGYVLNQYDCSNMAYDLCLELDSLGYDCRILTIRPTDRLHAIVEVVKNNETFYYDPTRKFPVVTLKDRVLQVWTVTQIKLLKDYPNFDKMIVKDFAGHLVEHKEIGGK